MDLTSLILEDLAQVHEFTKHKLQDVGSGNWFRQIEEGTNHIAWHVGHLTIVEYSLCLKRIRGEVPSDEALFPVKQFAELFGKGSTPSAKPDDYPAVEAILQAYDAVHARVLEETAKLSLSTLSESAGPPHPMFSTKADALRFCPKHEMLHTGKIELLCALFARTKTAA